MARVVSLVLPGWRMARRRFLRHPAGFSGASDRRPAGRLTFLLSTRAELIIAIVFGGSLRVCCKRHDRSIALPHGQACCAIDRR